MAPTSDPARCAPVRADSEEPGLYAEAAVDGAGATVWSPAADATTATLTAELASPTRIASVTPDWAVEPASYRVEVSADGRSWQGSAPGCRCVGCDWPCAGRRMGSRPRCGSWGCGGSRGRAGPGAALRPAGAGSRWPRSPAGPGGSLLVRRRVGRGRA
ncbi:discoidin domain-containing protein [Streptomyces albus]|nr:discoidin domain-containing protein [Streptomyces albus]